MHINTCIWPYDYLQNRIPTFLLVFLLLIFSIACTCSPLTSLEASMAKEADIKKIELRVTVDCCDGCKRKVKKALRGVEGVLKTEIDPSQPKVTATGNVDPKVLIKKLLRAGKQAELWSNGNQSAVKEVKVDMPVTYKKEQSKPECEKAKPSDACGNATDRDKEGTRGGNGNGDIKAAKKEDKIKESTGSSFIPQVTKNENPFPSQPEVGHNMYPKTLLEADNNIRTQSQYSYMVQPYPVTVPYYAIPPYAIHHLPLPPPPCYGQPFYCHERPDFQPMFQAPVTRVGDYFSDENTIGCSVM